MIAAGFGFRSSATEASLGDALAKSTSHLPAGAVVTTFASAADKSEAPVFKSFSRAYDVAVVPVPANRLALQTTETLSAQSLAHRGTGSVAEAAALAAAGPGARLIGPRAVSDDGCATCALAEGEGER